MDWHESDSDLKKVWDKVRAARVFHRQKERQVREYQKDIVSLAMIDTGRKDKIVKGKIINKFTFPLNNGRDEMTEIERKRYKKSLIEKINAEEYDIGSD